MERAVEINAENDRLRGREKEVEEENARHLKEREQLEKERLVPDLFSVLNWVMGMGTQGTNCASVTLVTEGVHRDENFPLSTGTG